MKGPALFLIVMTFLVLMARREARWAARQEELRRARAAIAAFNEAWPRYKAAIESMQVALEEFGTVANLAAWQMRRSARRSDRVDALQYALYRNVTAVTPEADEADTLPAADLPAGREE